MSINAVEQPAPAPIWPWLVGVGIVAVIAVVAMGGPR